MLQGKSDRKTSNLQHALIKNGPSAALLIQHTWQYIYKKNYFNLHSSSGHNFSILKLYGASNHNQEHKSKLKQQSSEGPSG